MRSGWLALVTVLGAKAALADGLWQALAEADAVVQARVDRVEGERAVLVVEHTFKGAPPKELRLRKDGRSLCFTVERFAAGDEVVVLLKTGAHLVRDVEQRVDAGREDADAIGRARSYVEVYPWDVSGQVLRPAKGEGPQLARVVEEALERHAAHQPPTTAWGIALLRLQATRAAGDRFFEDRERPMSDDVRQELARQLVAGAVSVARLERVLRWLQNQPGDDLTRAGMAVVKAALAAPKPDARSAQQALMWLSRRVKPTELPPMGSSDSYEEVLREARATFGSLEQTLAKPR